MITNYYLEDIDNYEEFLNKLFIGLSHYQKKLPHMTFNIKYDGKTIQLTTYLPEHGQLN